MSLFRRRRHEEVATGVPGLPELAAAQGFQPVSGQFFDGLLERRVQEVSRVLHGFPSRRLSMGTSLGIPPMFYSDSYRGTIDGRQVTFANAWTPMESMELSVAARVHGTSVVAVELPSTLFLQGIEPRAKHSAFVGSETPTGNPAFDRAFRVVGMAGLGPDVVTPGVQQHIMTRDDWAFTVERYWFACIAKGGFATADEVSDRVRAVLEIVAAVPSSVLPDHVDHSFDDLLARINALNGIDEAIAFLRELSPADRERLARSNTPLATFADVQTPEEAIARFESLDEKRRLEIITMFMKVQDS